jgi:hypothetical protein
MELVSSLRRLKYCNRDQINETDKMDTLIEISVLKSFGCLLF